MAFPAAGCYSGFSGHDRVWLQWAWPCSGVENGSRLGSPPRRHANFESNRNAYNHSRVISERVVKFGNSKFIVFYLYNTETSILLKPFCIHLIVTFMAFVTSYLRDLELKSKVLGIFRQEAQADLPKAHTAMLGTKRRNASRIKSY